MLSQVLKKGLEQSVAWGVQTVREQLAVSHLF